MKILLYGLNYAPEEIGIGKYSAEMMEGLAEGGHWCTVVTTPPYYPQWKVAKGYKAWRYQRESHGFPGYEERKAEQEHMPLVEIVRCPLWVPKEVTGLKRMIHLASFGLSGIPAVLWKAIRFRPDVIITVEPAAMCMPTTWLAGRLCGARTWLHVQDFEIDAAIGLGIVKFKWLERLVLGGEAWLMRRFDRVSSISPNMLAKLEDKGVPPELIRPLPNWVDCEAMHPLEPEEGEDAHAMRRRLRATFGLPADAFVALYAGNMGVKQGLEVVVEAARQVGKLQATGHVPDRERVHVVICGHGATHSQVAESVAGLGNVQMLPVQPLEAFNDLMNCADVHLLPQRAGVADLVMPSKLTGMLATGRPVIACADPNTQIMDVVDGHGLVVPPGDAQALVRAICELAGEPERCVRLGCAARKYAVEHLSRDSSLASLLDELKVLTGRRKEVVRALRSWGQSFGAAQQRSASGLSEEGQRLLRGGERRAWVLGGRAARGRRHRVRATQEPVLQPHPAELVPVGDNDQSRPGGER